MLITNKHGKKSLNGKCFIASKSRCDDDVINIKLICIFRRECPQGPRLAKFGGKAKEFSPRARFRHLLGLVTCDVIIDMTSSFDLIDTNTRLIVMIGL